MELGEHALTHESLATQGTHKPSKTHRARAYLPCPSLGVLAIAIGLIDRRQPRRQAVTAGFVQAGATGHAQLRVRYGLLLREVAVSRVVPASGHDPRLAGRFWRL